jgi:hypothetical protein
MTTDTMQRIETFFNRDNEAEGVEHFTTFEHIPRNLVEYLINIWKL